MSSARRLATAARSTQSARGSPQARPSDHKPRPDGPDPAWWHRPEPPPLLALCLQVTQNPRRPPACARSCLAGGRRRLQGWAVGHSEPVLWLRRCPLCSLCQWLARPVPHEPSARPQRLQEQPRVLACVPMDTLLGSVCVCGEHAVSGCQSLCTPPGPPAEGVPEAGRQSPGSQPCPAGCSSLAPRSSGLDPDACDKPAPSRRQHRSAPRGPGGHVSARGAVDGSGAQQSKEPSSSNAQRAAAGGEAPGPPGEKEHS